MDGEKITIVLIADVKYPSSNNSYLTANSYVIEKGNMESLEASEKDFKSKVEVDGFKIVNFLAYIIPENKPLTLSGEMEAE